MSFQQSQKERRETFRFNEVKSNNNNNQLQVKHNKLYILLTF